MKRPNRRFFGGSDQTGAIRRLSVDFTEHPTALTAPPPRADWCHGQGRPDLPRRLGCLGRRLRRRNHDDGRPLPHDAHRRHEVTLRFLAAPTDVNWGGKVHGGIVMKWIDTAAYLCSSRYCGQDTVAVFSGGIRFYRPLHIGDLVEVEARLIYTGSKGMHVAVHVRSGDPKGDELALTTYCLTVMVARDEHGNAVPVPAWEPVTDEDRALWQHARDLLEIRVQAPGNRLPNHLLERRD